MCYSVKCVLDILLFEIFHFYIQIKSVCNGFNVHWMSSNAFNWILYKILHIGEPKYSIIRVNFKTCRFRNKDSFFNFFIII